MHFVSHGPAPEKLEEYKTNYTQKWVDHYQNKQGPKPSDSYWTKDEIRAPLVRRFEDNCGYCGVGIGERHSKSGRMLPVGEVDHYRPKSKYPSYVYVWENFIWSCTDCNKQKKDYYNSDLMLLYPGDIEDTRILELRRDGKYYLKQEFSDNELLEKRYRKTCRKTLLNSGVRPDERKLLKHIIDGLLKSLPKYWEKLHSDEFQRLPSEWRSIIKERLHDSISLLKEILERKSYRKMIRSMIEPEQDSMEQWLAWHESK